ncbi:dihydrolipoyl dehydrogenase [Paenibacillus sp. J31TS4]|uniref:dihydrolipoyl dehydrogenase n=1 Tax=Paenibacillus sp. J31TS4 TaxID=2807195 RepID=UPI001B117302|nr:dihydrolipoyl dehydrogenase [Paenibacillus sp. J31TS4]GIP37568.1 dihydrolipoyl dehydrogenase [Paenibacillus sp. J31TS4]
MSKPYDVVILGGGTGGYVAAIRAAQLGLATAIVEKEKLGGTCLHKGCIPSKALLRSAELLAQMKNSETFGIVTESVAVDFARVQSRKQGIVDQLHRGVEYLMKKNKIDVYRGSGRVIGPSIFSPRSGSVAVEFEDGESETLVPRHLIIATGSRPRLLPGLEADGETVLTSDDALRLETLPGSMLIVGGGVIGVEWASMLSDFGVAVTLVEYEPRLLPLEDEEVSRELEKQLRKRGVTIHTSAKVLPDTLERGDGSVKIEAEGKDGLIALEADKLLVSVGRRGNVENLGLENTNIAIEGGFIQVNEHFQTAESHIYAIGDVIGGVQLAHAASHEGLAAVEHLAGGEPVRHEAHRIPRCIYSRPEAASVGWTEQEARERGHAVRVGKVPFTAIGKALVQGEAEGFVKVVADERTGDVLGVHMIGPHVTDLIAEAGLAQLLDATPWEIGQAVAPHPTLSEALAEAMLAVQGRAIGI